MNYESETKWKLSHCIFKDIKSESLVLFQRASYQLHYSQGVLRISFFVCFWVKMQNWKLLGDLEPEELRLECERANLSSSEKSSHNCIKLSKYILGNGYDPETFYFNTHYKADKTNPLMGMSAPAGQVGAACRLTTPRQSVANVAKTSLCSTDIPINPTVSRRATFVKKESSGKVLQQVIRLVTK